MYGGRRAGRRRTYDNKPVAKLRYRQTSSLPTTLSPPDISATRLEPSNDPARRTAALSPVVPENQEWERYHRWTEFSSTWPREESYWIWLRSTAQWHQQCQSAATDRYLTAGITPPAQWIVPLKGRVSVSPVPPTSVVDVPPISVGGSVACAVPLYHCQNRYLLPHFQHERRHGRHHYDVLSPIW